MVDNKPDTTDEVSQRTQRRAYNRRLLIGSSGKWVEVGQCLTDEERESLANAVRTRIRQQLTLG